MGCTNRIYSLDRTTPVGTLLRILGSALRRAARCPSTGTPLFYLKNGDFVILLTLYDNGEFAQVLCYQGIVNVDVDALEAITL